MAKKAEMKVNKTTDETIKDLQKALEAQIEKFEQKQKLITNRKKFVVTREKLQSFLSEQGSDFNEFLDNDDKKIVFKNRVSYRDDDAISISNNHLVREFVQFLIEKIDHKLAEIEKAIVA